MSEMSFLPWIVLLGQMSELGCKFRGVQGSFGEVSGKFRGVSGKFRGSFGEVSGGSFGEVSGGKFRGSFGDAAVGICQSSLMGHGNSLLRCLAAQTDVHSTDVSSSLRCLLHCMRRLDLDVRTARRRGWGEKMP